MSINCLNFALLLDEHLDGRLGVDAAAQCDEHLARCGACATRREDGRRLLDSLRSLQAAEPDADFCDRVLAAARSAPVPRATLRRQAWPSWPGALAAGLLLAIGLLSWTRPEAIPEVQAGGLEPVRLVFRSDSALQGVTIELQLPQGLELVGYPGEQTLVWTSDLRRGENLLELPVRTLGQGGVLTATLNHGGERKQFSVRVVAAPEGTPMTQAAPALVPAVFADRGDYTEEIRHG